MKRIRKAFATILVVSVIFSLPIFGSASAATPRSLSEAELAEAAKIAENVNVRVNGEIITFPDAQPFIDENDRTLIPVRFVAEELGANVGWEPDTETAIIEQNGINIRVPIGNSTLTVNDNGTTFHVVMNTSAILKEDRTYVPIRFVAETLGAWVSYSDMYNTVQIYRDVLSPEEITRLHSYYDKTRLEQAEMTKTNIYRTEEEIAAMHPEYARFIGDYGFENANEYKLINPNGKKTIAGLTSASYKGVLTGIVCDYSKGSALEDFSRLMLEEARAAAKELSEKAKIDVTFKSDLSCVYASRHSNEAGTWVRGVITVSVPKNANMTEVRKNFPTIKDLKAGETKCVDAGILIYTFTSDVHWSEIETLSAPWTE